MIETNMWLGSAESLDFVLKASEKVDGMLAARGGDFALDLPPLFQAHDGVAVLDVNGPLIVGSAGFFRLFGITGYDDIRQALTEAAAKKDVKAILMNVNSPGGSASGIEDVASHIKAVDKLKPVLAHTSTVMASAAYWLGSSARRILATRSAEAIGSIGTVMVHTERSEMLKKDGIKATIIRSGKFKMAVNSVEPLTDEIRADIQAKVDDMANLFEMAVAENLGVPQKTVHEKMGQGRTFLGFRAQEVGLVHGIASFDEAFAVAKILGSR